MVFLNQSRLTAHFQFHLTTLTLHSHTCKSLTSHLQELKHSCIYIGDAVAIEDFTGSFCRLLSPPWREFLKLLELGVCLAIILINRDCSRLLTLTPIFYWLRYLPPIYEDALHKTAQHIEQFSLQRMKHSLFWFYLVSKFLLSFFIIIYLVPC